jgi:hypothetical protein
VGIGNALEYLSSEQMGLLSLKREQGAPSGAASSKPSSFSTADVSASLIADEAAYQDAISGSRRNPDNVLGVLVRARLDTDHWLSVGCERGVNVLYEGNTIYAPLKLDEGVNVGYLAEEKELLQSGYLWDTLRAQLAFKPVVVVQTQGRGNVVGFVTNPNFRAVMDGNNLLLLNAVFRGPAHSRRARGD